MERKIKVLKIEDLDIESMVGGEDNYEYISKKAETSIEFKDLVSDLIEAQMYSFHRFRLEEEDFLNEKEIKNLRRLDLIDAEYLFDCCFFAFDFEEVSNAIINHLIEQGFEI